jgi:hypothetical protein
MRGVDRPLLLIGNCTNRISLPSGADAFWLGKDSNEFSLKTSKASEKMLVFVPNEHGVFAARHRVNGSWSSIYPVMILSDAGGKNDGIREIASVGVPEWRFVQGDVSENKATSVPLKVDAKVLWRIEVLSHRLGSPLDAVIRVLDPSGKQVAFGDDSFAAGRDPIVQFKADMKGVYTVEVRDVANAGGPNYFFALRASWPQVSSQTALLRIDERPPNWKTYRERRTLPDELDSLQLGSLVHDTFSPARHYFGFLAQEKETVVFQAETRRFGSRCDAGIELFDAKGKLISESTGADANGPALTNRFEKGGTYKLAIRELAKQSGLGFDYWLKVLKAEPGVILNCESERMDFSKDGEAKLKVSCQRFGCDGPVKLKIEGLSERLAIIDGTIPEKKSEGELRLKLNGEGAGFHIRIFGEIEQNEPNATKRFPVSTMPALRKLYPLQMFPSAAMDGWIAVNPPAR